MHSRCSFTTRRFLAEAGGRDGMTLLEVLVACGILVIGLASVAALLPAAGSRLQQAAVEDRAGTLAANAFAAAMAGRLIHVDIFGDPDRSVAFGKGMERLAANEVGGNLFAAASGKLQERIDPNRGFQLEDEVLFGPPVGGTPVNEFVDGVRSFKQGLCWGGTLVPDSFPAEAGVPAVLAVAVFRRDAVVERVPLTTIEGGLYRMTTLDEDKLKKFLKSCSYVLVPPTDQTKGPRWFRVTASWRPPIDPATGKRPNNDGCYIAFADPALGEFAGKDPAVIGFDGLVRVDQYNVILE